MKKPRAPKTYEYTVLYPFRFYVIDKYIEGKAGDVLRLTLSHASILQQYLEKK